MRFSKLASVVIPVLATMALSTSAFAEGIQKPEVGVGYQFGSAKQSGDSDRTNLNGFYVDFSGQLPGKTMPLAWRWVGRFDGSFKGSESGNPDSLKVWGYQGGVNFSSMTNPKYTPFGQIMIGGGHVGQGSFSANGLLFDIEGGVGFPVSGKVNVKASVGYRRLNLSDDNGGGVNILGVRIGINMPIGQ